MARVAILLADDFEDLEYRVLVDRLRDAGNEVIIVGPRRGLRLQGQCGLEETEVSAEYFDFCPEQFHGIAIPGGQSARRLCTDQRAIQFLRLFFLSGRPIVAIGSGPELLIPAGLAAGCQVTAAPSLKSVMERAGAGWIDAPVVLFGNGHIITCRGALDADRAARVFIRCLCGSQSITSPREAPPELPPLDC